MKVPPTWFQKMDLPDSLKETLHSERLESTKDNIFLLSILLFLVGILLFIQHLLRPAVPENTVIWQWYFGAFIFVIFLAGMIGLITQTILDKLSLFGQRVFMQAVAAALLLTTTGLSLLDLKAGNDLSVYLVGIFLLASAFRLGKPYNAALINASALVMIIVLSWLDYQVNIQIFLAIVIYAVISVWVAFTLENQRIENLLLRTELSKRNQELEQLSSRDSLTGAYNRRAFFEHITVLAEQCKRYGSDLSLAIIDIDKFKRVNDSLGHAAGDRVLKNISAKLIQATRSADITARYGGEEFIVAMSNTHLKSAMTVAERLRKEIEYLRVPEVNWTITISIGVAMYRPRIEELEETLIRADQAMYRAKAKGGNAVSAARLEPDQGDALEAL